MRNLFLAFCLFIAANTTNAQQQFSVSINPSPITAVPATHSGAFAEWNDKWIFIGGRKDGLHAFNGGSAFDVFDRNDSAFVVDPVSNIRWSSSLTVLSPMLYEAVCSANLEY
jgi:hypothetical protein